MACAAALLLAAGCDRKVEPFVPGEQARRPDLSEIFPPRIEPEQVLEPAQPPPPPLARVAVAAQAVRGRVLLSSEFEDSTPEGAVLFVIARRAAGGPPLAVKRIAQPRFPLEFAIGPEDRMLESVPFAGPMLLSARLDSDGNATTRQSGDLRALAAAPVRPGDSGVRLVLDRAL